MMARLARILISALLALALPVLTLAHEDEVRAYSAAGEVSAHHHGPNAPCREDGQHHCLACAASSLFAPAPAISRPTPPRMQGILEGAVSEGASVAAPPETSGRSPPLPST